MISNASSVPQHAVVSSAATTAAAAAAASLTFGMNTSSSSSSVPITSNGNGSVHPADHRLLPSGSSSRSATGDGPSGVQVLGSTAHTSHPHPHPHPSHHLPFAGSYPGASHPHPQFFHPYPQFHPHPPSGFNNGSSSSGGSPFLYSQGRGHPSFNPTRPAAVAVPPIRPMVSVQML